MPRAPWRERKSRKVSRSIMATILGGRPLPEQLHVPYTVPSTVAASGSCAPPGGRELYLAAAQPPCEDAVMLDTAPLYHQLAEQIHEMIRAGTLRAGDRVPSVRSLSQQQNVSVSTVLQAYQRLEDNGVIEARPQSGYYVRRAPADLEEPA